MNINAVIPYVGQEIPRIKPEKILKIKDFRLFKLLIIKFVNHKLKLTIEINQNTSKFSNYSKWFVRHFCNSCDFHGYADPLSNPLFSSIWRSIRFFGWLFCKYFKCKI